MPCCIAKALRTGSGCTCSANDKLYRRLVKALGLPDESSKIRPCDLPAVIERLRRRRAEVAR